MLERLTTAQGRAGDRQHNNVLLGHQNLLQDGTQRQVRQGNKFRHQQKQRRLRGHA